VKTGTSRSAAATRRGLFFERFLVNGHNATDAAIAAGCAPGAAKVTGARIMARPDVQAAVATRAARTAEAAEITAERRLRELSAIACRPGP
jgi:phage terminase small subunit